MIPSDPPWSPVIPSDPEWSQVLAIAQLFPSEASDVLEQRCPITGLDVRERLVLAFVANGVWLPVFNNEAWPQRFPTEILSEQILVQKKKIGRLNHPSENRNRTGSEINSRGPVDSILGISQAPTKLMLSRELNILLY